MKLEFTVAGEEEGMRLGAFLRRRGASVSFVRRVKFLDNGLVVNGVRARTNLVLKAGDRVEAQMPPDGDFSAAPQDLPLTIVYESAHAMVIDKEAGRVMHPTFTHTRDTLAGAFSGLLCSRGETAAFRAIGRLDANTSGLVLCAMSSFAAPALTASLEKTYYALAAGELPEEGVIDAPLGPRPGSAILQQVAPGGKPSITEYRRLALGGGASLVEVKPRTGRTHQIRVHFAHMGHPLLGDGLYGGDTALLSRQALHCGRIRFAEPGEQPMALFSALPPDMQRAAAALGIGFNFAG